MSKKAAEKKTKIIKDMVHDYITVSQFYLKLIDTEQFQRLRFIRQLTCQYVYPAANHTRFEHSLGVFHLSRKYISKLKNQLFQLGIDNTTYGNMRLNLSIAALLHDVGHAPMSHLGEHYYSKKEIIRYLKAICTDKDINSDIFDVNGCGAPHELMSCYIILQYFYDLIVDNVHYHKVDFELICRMIIGAEYKTEDKWFEDLGIRVLNSDTIDMDKLDYIIRDSYMTGVSVPSIDVHRLFSCFYIMPTTKKVVVKNQAITVVQNIIDARDCLYMLVCNHHIAVYTDFVFEFYMKHLILKDDKGKQASTRDSMKANEFFSCEAIGKRLVTDNDLISKLKEYYVNNRNVSEYTKVISPQIFAREFLKPLWKNLYEFKLFMDNSIIDSNAKDDLLEKMCSAKTYIYRSYVAKEIIKRLNLKNGQVFIVPRPNKFYMDSKKSKFYILVDDNLKEISELLPQKKYGSIHSDVAFYVFAPKAIKEDVKREFIKIAREGIPSEDKIRKMEGYIESIPKWMQ